MSVLPAASAVLAPGSLVDDALRPHALVPAFQPIVDLAGGETVAYEALARWPGLLAGSPGDVFAAAAEVGRTHEVDWACRTGAIAAALEAADLGGRTLFLNVEPVSVGRPLPAQLQAVAQRANGRLRIVLELTERALFQRPAELMRTVEAARARGCGVALDDVGADPASLAMLPFVQPDVIKLDMSLIQHVPGPVQARVITAVLAHVERTGATVLAEGIETPAQREQAISLGATLGQGWLLGRPATLPPDSPTLSRSLRIGGPIATTPASPFDLVAHGDDLRVGRKSMLLALSQHIEDQALNLGAPPIILSTFQTAERFTAGTRRRYRRLAVGCPFVAALGEHMSDVPEPGVRGGRIEPGDPLRGEWTVVVVGDHYAGALIARDLGDDGPDADRRFAFVVTHDRDTVVAAGRSLMSRLMPRG